jgi:hypothetical protein
LKPLSTQRTQRDEIVSVPLVFFPRALRQKKSAFSLHAIARLFHSTLTGARRRRKALEIEAKRVKTRWKGFAPQGSS